ncbi:unnamed protein product, partial [Ectocarpus sp. 12 AP-2014]
GQHRVPVPYTRGKAFFHVCGLSRPVGTLVDFSRSAPSSDCSTRAGERQETCNAMSAYVDDAPAADGRIVELAKQTTSRLEVLWDEVGYTSDEKRRQMQGLVDGFQTLCENKEKQEEGVKSQFVTSIADAKDRIKTARKKLGQEHTEVCWRYLM